MGILLYGWVQPNLSNEEGLEKQFVLAAGENEEVCLTVYPDQEFKLTFSASELVYHDIHTHHDEEVLIIDMKLQR